MRIQLRRLIKSTDNTSEKETKESSGIISNMRIRKKKSLDFLYHVSIVICLAEIDLALLFLWTRRSLNRSPSSNERLRNPRLEEQFKRKWPIGLRDAQQ